VLIRGAEVEGRAPIDVRIAGDRIAEIGAALARGRGEAELDARGGALLPGLHDHHIHLHALAAAQSSIACGPPAVRNAMQLVFVLRRSSKRGSGWLRGIAYHESVAGARDRARLDLIVPDRPLRIQHRTGALWMLNSAGLRELGLEHGPEAETGRLFRSDAWLRARIGGEFPDLGVVGVQLSASGVTGVTDASVSNDAPALGALCSAVERAALPQQLFVMGTADLPAPTSARVARGAVKAMLDDPSLPDFEQFCARIRSAHESGRGFAVHCATRGQGVFAAAAFREAGVIRGDRLEHASVAPPELVAEVAGLGLTIVTQPNFVAERGDDYRRDVEPADLPWLYRARGWLAAGVPLAAGSDAPYGALDPWRGIAAAVRRVNPSGAALAPDEALTPEQALALYLAPLSDPGGPARRVAVGAPADLCLLDRPWREARERLEMDDVSATWCAGRLVWQRDVGTSTYSDGGSA
jgi:predicted amidohydrolase YtcJ